MTALAPCSLEETATLLVRIVDADGKTIAETSLAPSASPVVVGRGADCRLRLPARTRVLRSAGVQRIV